MIVETEGGYIEVADRIVDAIRHYYGEVEFFIPNYAMSAGTVLVMSGDAIHMDYYSVLGPIDPQVRRPGSGRMVPALGYLVQYKRLLEKSSKQPLSTAELTILVECFDQAELYHYEQCAGVDGHSAGTVADAVQVQELDQDGHAREARDGQLAAQACVRDCQGVK